MPPRQIGPTRVNHEARREFVAVAEARLARATAPGVALDEFGEKPGAGGAVDRTVDTAAATQRLVGGVDDRIDALLGKVSLADLDLDHVAEHRPSGLWRDALVVHHGGMTSRLFGPGLLLCVVFTAAVALCELGRR